MQTEYLITVDEFCSLHSIETSFIDSLRQTGLISLTSIDEREFIDARQLQQLEKFIRLYYEFDINMEGIETVTHLLHRITTLQDEIIALRNRLRLYESNE